MKKAKNPTKYLIISVTGGGQILTMTYKKAELSEAKEKARKMWAIMDKPECITIKSDVGEQLFFKRS